MNEIDIDVHEENIDSSGYSFMQTTLINYVVSTCHSAQPLGNKNDKEAMLTVLKVLVRRQDKYTKRMIRCKKKSVQEGTIFRHLAL